jgi:hypothetical protein
MSSRPVIITPKLIRRYNFRCVGRVLLWALGAAAVFMVIFLFVWVLASVVTRQNSLTLPIITLATLVAGGVFVAGHLYLKKHGPQDWERIAQKPDRKPGMRLSRMSNQEYGQIGVGGLALVLAGPGWIGRIYEEWRAVIPATEDMADRLENLRKHFAARDSWVPMKDFSAHEDGIYLLAKLDILAIRELLGEWYFHVTVQGTVKRLTKTEFEAGR